MAIAPTGILSTPLLTLKKMLSESALFQAFVGVASAALALPFIHLVAVKSGDISFPYALIMPGGWGRNENAGGARNHFTPSGVLGLKFEDVVLTANKGSSADTYFAFANQVGPIISELEDLAGASLADGTGALQITAIETENNVMRASEFEEQADEDRTDILFDITWGIA